MNLFIVDSLRAQISVEGVNINQFHGSDSDQTAKEELQYFFGEMQQTMAVIKPDAFQTKGESLSIIYDCLAKM